LYCFNPPTEKVVVADGAKRYWLRWFGIANLVSTPPGYDSEKAKWFEAPIDVQKDVDLLTKCGVITTNDDKVIDSIITCRSLYNWVAKDYFADHYSTPIVHRQTQTAIPPGEYVFDVRGIVYQGFSEYVPRTAIIDLLGDSAPFDWATRADINAMSQGLISWDPHEYSFINPIHNSVTVCLSKSDWHAKSTDVSSKTNKGKKSRETKEKGNPGPQLDVR
jgi:hypothetical protein